MTDKDTRPSVLCVSHYFEDHRGGIEIVAGRVARELAAQGWVVRWAATDAAPGPLGQVIDVVALRAWNGVERRMGLPFPVPSLAAVRELDRVVARSAVVLIHDALYLTSLLAVFSARRRRRPVVLVQHIAEIRYRNPILRFLMRLANATVTRPMLRAADQVVFISGTTAAAFDGLVLRRPAELVFNGVDTEVFTPAADEGERRARRGQLGLPTDRPIALFVGRFVEKKGLHVLHEMARRRSDLHVALVGWGPMDPSEWQLSNVSVLTELRGPTLATAYQAADVLVLPSTGEGFPLVVQEAMSSGLSVVCGLDSAGADPGATPLLTGVRVEVDDPVATATAFLAAVDDVLADPGRGSASRRDYACTHYSWHSRGDRYAELVGGLASGSIGPDVGPSQSRKAP